MNNMIPDKIYIRHYWMPGELDDEWRLKPVEDEQCEEYIHKDLLIEWMEQYEKRTRTAIIPLLVKDFIEKLNSL